MPALGRHGARTTLGPNYRKLWTATAISTIGDGIHFTALPLLAATLTRDPLQLSAVAFAGYLPWLLFALVSGALVDRWDRRRVMWTVDTFRFAVVGGLAVAVMAEWASIPLLMASGFLLGIGQTLFDTASQSIVPAIVSRDPARLERANGRLSAAMTVGQQFLGPPAGGFLFSVAASVPFMVDAVSFAASSALIAAIRGQYSRRQAVGAPTRTLRADISEGLRWLLAHRLLRTLAIMVGVANLAFAAGEAILVLFAQDRLGLGSLGFGLLLTGLAAGAVLGSLLAGRLSQWLGTGRLLPATVVAEAAASFGIGLTTHAWFAGAMLGLAGAAVGAWNVITVSLRQAIVPEHLFGRVNSVYKLLALGTLPLGAILGGVLGRTLGLPAPFLTAGAILLALAVLTLPIINTKSIAAARIEADATP
jgi:MFS family permease